MRSDRDKEAQSTTKTEKQRAKSPEKPGRGSEKHIFNLGSVTKVEWTYPQFFLIFFVFILRAKSEIKQSMV